ncbi:GAF domain-containing protein, partial [bacterium]|nr:GAF domain-containing protein [bacterium]
MPCSFCSKSSKRDIPSDAGEICLWNEKERRLVQRGWIGDAIYLLTVAEQGGGYTLGQGAAGWAAEHRQALLITGQEQTISVRDLLKGTPYRSSMVLPLLNDNGLVGTVTLFSHAPERYDTSTLALMQAISRTLITVIENALSYSRQEDRIRDIASIQQIAEHSQAGREAAPVYGLLNERIAKLADAEYSGIYLYDEEHRQLVPQLPFYGLVDQIAAYLTIPLGEDSPQDDIWRQQPYWVSNDLTDEPLTEALGLKELLSTIGLRNTALIPLQVAGERIGVLAVSNRRLSGFTPSDIQNLRVLASQAALVVENIRLYQREQLIDNELLGLQEMTHAIGALSHEGEFYAEITERIARLMNSLMCGILLYDAKERALIAQLPFFGVDEALVKHYRIPLPLGSVMEEIWTDEEAWMSNRVATDPLVFAAGLDVLSEGVGVKKTMIAVMAAGGRRLGVVQVSNKIDTTDYNSKDARLLQIFATQAAAIVENARLYREVRLRAEQADILRRVAEQAGSVMTTEQSFQPVLQEISRFMGSPLVYINVIDSTTNTLITYPRWIFGIVMQEPIAQDLSAPGYQNIPAMSGHPFLSNDVLNEKYVLPMYRKMAQTFRMRTVVMVPLTLGERNLGELGVANRPNRPYTQDDITALSTIAAQIAPALERLLLYETTGENLRRRIGRAGCHRPHSVTELSGTVDLERILTVIRQELQNATDASDTTILILHEPTTWADPQTPELARRVGGGAVDGEQGRRLRVAHHPDHGAPVTRHADDPQDLTCPRDAPPDRAALIFQRDLRAAHAVDARQRPARQWDDTIHRTGG